MQIVCGVEKKKAAKKTGDDEDSVETGDDPSIERAARSDSSSSGDGKYIENGFRFICKVFFNVF